MKLISYLQIRKHICTLLFLMREFARKLYSSSAQVKKKNRILAMTHLNVSDGHCIHKVNSIECDWL